MKDKIKSFPDKPWVYFFKDWKDNILYIWKAKSLKKRVSQYFQSSSMWKQDMIAKAKDVNYMTVNTENEALILETNLINKHKPRYNNLIRWERSFTYIKITNEQFPQILFTRYRDNDWWIYIWPKYFRHDLKKLLQILRQLLWYRWCKITEFKKWKLCSDFMFGICKGWCVFAKLKISNPKFDFLWDAKKLWFDDSIWYEWSLEESKKLVDFIVKFFKWDSKPMEKLIIGYINEAVEKQNFEWAGKLRDIYYNIEKYVESQSVILDKPLCWYAFKVKKIWKFYVYGILNIFEWKIIDILRFRELKEEFNINQLFGSLNLEMWDFYITDDSPNNKFWISNSFKNSWKKIISQISQLIDEAIDSYINASAFDTENVMNELLLWFQNKYKLPYYPYRIECIDISHLSWSWVSGWLSCLLWWVPYKKWYRYYKIKSSIWKSSYNNDYEALWEIVKRRFVVWNNKDLPEYFILDWWKWQLWIMKEILMKYSDYSANFSKTYFMSIWKWKARKNSAKLIWESEKLYILRDDLFIDEIEMNYDDSDKLIIKLRDEAHRFANKYRKKQMSKEFK